MKKVTIYSLAEELNMSPSMVSRAFNPEAKIATEKRQLVLKTAEKYNFVPNKFASRLSMKTIRIGVLIHCRAEFIKEKMVSGIEEAYADIKDYKVEYALKIIHADERSPEECEKDLFAFSEFDGVILSGFGSTKCKDMIDRFILINKNVVFLQNVCEDTDYLFASKHDEALASEIAAEILSDRLYYSERKNILFFTGDMNSSVHRSAKSAFISACERNGLNIKDIFDMHDSERELKILAEQALKKYEGEIDGIYITSGNSISLCELVRKRKVKTSLVTFDVFSEICEYIEDKTVCATIFQNMEQQAKTAFSRLSQFIIDKKSVEKTIYTDVVPVFKSSLKIYR